MSNKGELTRRRIIEEAASLFNLRGFAGCSMGDIMEATGLEKGGLYRHFASKEELAIEAFKYALERSVKTRAVDLDPLDSTIDRLLQMLNRFIAEPSPLPGGCPLMNTAIDSDDGNPALRALARRGILAWKQRLSNLVEEGISSGEISGEVRPQRIANAIVSTLEGSLMISRLEGTRSAMIDAQETLSDLLRGLRAHQPQ